MSAARDAILGAIRAATQDVPVSEPAAWTPDEPGGLAPLPPGAHQDPGRLGIPTVGGAALLALAAERIADYQATVTRVSAEDGIAAGVLAILLRHQATRIAVPGDLSSEVIPRRHGLEICPDGDPPLTNADLGAVDAVLTGCALVIADTGTIVLDGGVGQGRRALTLLPDLHVCVIAAAAIVHTVPEAVALLASVQRPITLISGPSATSDIELARVEGVHGPRRLEVLIAG